MNTARTQATFAHYDLNGRASAIVPVASLALVLVLVLIISHTGGGTV